MFEQFAAKILFFVQEPVDLRGRCVYHQRIVVVDTSGVRVCMAGRLRIKCLACFLLVDGLNLHGRPAFIG